MPNYREIYNHIVDSDPRYQLAENSPGLRLVTMATDRLSMLTGRSLDVGCGVGFAVQYLGQKRFDLNVFGVDISDRAIELAKRRVAGMGGLPQRLLVVDDQTLPFEDDYFQLVTCFDMLEHLDEVDIRTTLDEIHRVLAPGANLFLTVSCRPAGIFDLNGDNLHRTVQSVDWWISEVEPDTAEYDAHRQQLSLWKHIPRRKTPKSAVESASSVVATGDAGISEVATEEAKTQAHFQKLFDDDAEFGNADQDRSAAVTLLADYKDWIKSPVMDLGCGRGQAVEQLRSLGMQSEGIDQVCVNPEMRVGDMCQPIADMDQFNSVICLDCIDQLAPSQILGLFENMKQVERQAFSISNGEEEKQGLPAYHRDFIDWTKLIREHLDIALVLQISPNENLYLTQRKVEEDPEAE